MLLVSPHAVPAPAAGGGVWVSRVPSAQQLVGAGWVVSTAGSPERCCCEHRDTELCGTVLSLLVGTVQLLGPKANLCLND